QGIFVPKFGGIVPPQVARVEWFLPLYMKTMRKCQTQIKKLKQAVEEGSTIIIYENMPSKNFDPEEEDFPSAWFLSQYIQARLMKQKEGEDELSEQEEEEAEEEEQEEVEELEEQGGNSE